MLGCSSKTSLRAGPRRQKAAVLVLNLTWGAQLIVSIILTALDSWYLSALHSSLHPHPQQAHTTSQCHFSLESMEGGGGERSQASGCRLTRDGGQVWPEDTGSCAETAQGCVAAPTLEDEGSRGHRSLILSTSLCPCCILFGGLQWVFIAACGLSLIAASRGYSLVALCGLLIAMTSLVAEHELQSVQASVVVACGLSHCGTRAQLALCRWNPPRPGIEPASLALVGGFSPIGPQPQESPFCLCF